MKRIEAIVLGLVLLSFMVSLYFYPLMPEKIAIHWNVQGQVDGYASKFPGLFILPFLLTGIVLLFITIPRVDPLKENIEKFRKYYDGFVILFSAFMVFIHLYIISWNIGIRVSPNIVLPIGFGLLFFYCGILCENAKRNWFIGIRTPWTLSSERVWERTHKLGGRLFKACGLISIAGLIFPSHAVYFILIPVMFAAAFLIVFSYFDYQKEMRQLDESISKS
ncbi:MAG: SdpI family protein [Thaumarchaeota archaeon]|nr:SdpI family protein [Nitrososphaerota archaeon]